MTTLVFHAFAVGDQATGYRATFPDLPTLSVEAPSAPELLTVAREAVLAELKRLTDEGTAWPTPTPIELAAVPPLAFAFFVDVSVDDTPVRVNISIGEQLLKRIDEAAEARGMSRSGFIATAARAALGERPVNGEFEAVADRLQAEWSVLSRKITESLGPDSAFHRSMNEFDATVTDGLRRAVDKVTTAVKGRKAPRPAEPPPADAPETAATN